MVKLLAALAPAKINLFLRVTGRRGDGYHELDSIFLPISLADRLQVEMRTAAASSVMLRCSDANVPQGEGNLAVRAAKRFAEEFGITAQVAIDLHKEIPISAGLGGGSSDAGAVLRMMAALARIREPARLAHIALSLGADVPFFLDPRPARVRGIGERIAPLAAMPALELVIAAPPVEVSTASIFTALRPENWSGPAPEADEAALMGGAFFPKALINDLAPVAMALHPEIARLKALLEQCGAHAAAMTGSGGAVFGIFNDAGEAAAAYAEVSQRAPGVWVRAARSLSG
jgi:4-diphosphocytidyl-2-C-methyl-D-erythritol kinase